MPDSNMDYTIYSILAPFVCFTVAFLLIAILQKRRQKGAMALFWFVLCAEGYLIANYLALILDSEQGSLFFAKIENIFLSLTPVSWLWFVFDFIERPKWKQLKYFWPFFLLPLFDAVLVSTNDYHHLFWSEIRFVRVGDYNALQLTNGSLYYVAAFMSHAMILTGLLVVVSEFLRGRSVYRRQLNWIVAGILIALSFSLVYIFHPIPEIKKDLTPIGVALCAMAFFVGIFRHRFLDLNPTPRSRLFDAFRDVVVVIDGRKNIIDINRAAMSILGLAEADVGSSIHRCTLLAPVFNRLEGEVEGDVDISTGTGEGACHFEAHVDLLHKHDAVRKGAVIVLHDVTERVRMSEEIKTLRGILPICARCKKIRDDEGFWQSVEAYVSKRSYAEFSHSLCPDCLREFYSELGDKQGAAGD